MGYSMPKFDSFVFFDCNNNIFNVQLYFLKSLLYLSRIVYLYIIIWRQSFLSKTKDLCTVKWFQVFQSNIDNFIC